MATSKGVLQGYTVVLRSITRTRSSSRRSRTARVRNTSCWCRYGARPLHELALTAISAFIVSYRGASGVDPLREVFEIARSGCDRYRRQQLDARRRSSRSQRDGVLLEKIERVFTQHHEVHGIRKIWHQLQREGVTVARCDRPHPHPPPDPRRPRVARRAAEPPSDPGPREPGRRTRPTPARWRSRRRPLSAR